MSGYCDASLQPVKMMNGSDFFDTANMGFIQDGELVVVGCFKEMLAVNGRNIWPQDVEQGVNTISEFEDARVAAFAVESDDGETVVVLIECRRSQRDEDDALKRRAASITSFSVGITPHIELVRAGCLPLTSSDKLSRSTPARLILQAK